MNDRPHGHCRYTNIAPLFSRLPNPFFHLLPPNPQVLDNDPVPRALLSVDPTFTTLKGWTPVK